MNPITIVLSELEQGEPGAAEKLLPLVYEELRRLAAAKLRHEPPGQTLQATALVHEAFLRLTAGDSPNDWSGRAHFFGAAAESMRRILVDNARRKRARKHGGHRPRVDIPMEQIAASRSEDELLEVHGVLDEFAAVDAAAAQLVKLRYFVGLTMLEAATAMDVPLRSAERMWTFAKAWLFRRLRSE